MRAGGYGANNPLLPERLAHATAAAAAPSLCAWGNALDVVPTGAVAARLVLLRLSAPGDCGAAPAHIAHVARAHKLGWAVRGKVPGEACAGLSRRAGCHRVQEGGRRRRPLPASALPPGLAGEAGEVEEGGAGGFAAAEDACGHVVPVVLAADGAPIETTKVGGESAAPRREMGVAEVVAYMWVRVAQSPQRNSSSSRGRCCGSRQPAWKLRRHDPSQQNMRQARSTASFCSCCASAKRA